jgi:1-acyl-sn-glycerol-3-phosphate acyltransferase
LTKRPFGRTKAFATLAFALLRIPFWMAAPQNQRRRHEQTFFATISEGFGIRISLQGAPSTTPGTLFIMNHISWADIPVTMSILDADFVAKSEMQSWPVIGALARRFAPVFVARDERHRSHAQADAIRARLNSGRSVILCPEGTTSDGASILAFRTSLLAAADAATVIQPVILSYLMPNGAALSLDRRREVAWIDDDDLLSGAARLAKSTTLARVDFLPPVKAMDDRKALAEKIRQHMLAAYAAAPNRPK